ncbi:MAG: aryl-sulfate sulfotransferase [Ignavibacteria bacterium]|jgi:hypothetical protein|nr:aryl-sulfate sulfotransferase [Ignavibacteria bacterium]
MNSIAKKQSVLLILIFLIISSCNLKAQPYPGYTLITASSTRTNLMDLNNNVVKFWTHTRSGGYSVYLLRNGDLMRPATVSNTTINGGAAAGAVQKYSWTGSLIWEYTYNTTTVRTHHDICPLPNGNVLLIAWEVKTSAQAIAAGLNHSATIWPDHIIEVQPSGATGGTIVWKWHAWDHLIQDYDPTKANYGVVADHPELLDINVGSAGSGDWMHVNGISYNERLDQIVFSSHELDEVYVIDHSTTTEEAAGHTGGNSGKGGDFLYRWGRPSNYRAPGTQVFNVVHSGTWIPDSVPGGGNIMAFNNREGTNASHVIEIIPPVDSLGNYTLAPGTAYAPASPVWTYAASGFYSNHLGGCQRLANGNTMLSESTSGNLFEVNSAGTVVWSYSQAGEVVRVLRYGLDYPGLAGLVGVSENSNSNPDSYELNQNYPNPFNPSTSISYSLPKTSDVSLKIYDMLGNEVRSLLNNESKNAGSYTATWDGKNNSGANVSSGIYFYKLTADNFSKTLKMTLLK